MLNLLFICSQNRLRSPTAEQIFSTWEGVSCASAGVNHNAEVLLSGELLHWADVIFVMDRSHRNRVCRKFKEHLNDKRLICLGIPDDFEFMDPELIEILHRRVTPYLQARGIHPPDDEDKKKHRLKT